MMHSDPLTHNALSWLKTLDTRLCSRGSESRKTSVKTVAHVLSWCIEQGLIPANSLNLPDFTFTIGLLDAISSTQRQLRQTDFRTLHAGHNRIASARLSDQEIKTLGLRPRQQRVLVYLNNPLTSSEQMVIQVSDNNWHDLPLSQFDLLLVVENLDCFYQLAAFDLQLPGYTAPLIVYRGDKLYSPGVTALKAAWINTTKPAVYFGDFDAKGVSIAINEGYQGMLLPTLEKTLQLSSASMLPIEQIKFLPALENYAANSKFAPYLQLLLAQKGVRQQKMTASSLYIIDLSAIHSRE